MAGFIARRTEGGNSSGEQRQYIIGDSITLTIGDSVRFSSGYLDLCTNSGERVLGIVEGFVDQNGLPLVAQHATGTDYTESGNPGVPGSETVVTASDNTTDSQVMAVVNVDPAQEYYNDADGSLAAATLGTYFDVVAAGDQISASSSGSSGQFILLERDPDSDSDDSKGIFRIAESALHLG